MDVCPSPSKSENMAGLSRVNFYLSAFCGAFLYADRCIARVNFRLFFYTCNCNENSKWKSFVLFKSNIGVRNFELSVGKLQLPVPNFLKPRRRCLMFIIIRPTQWAIKTCHFILDYNFSVSWWSFTLFVQNWNKSEYAYSTEKLQYL